MSLQNLALFDFMGPGVWFWIIVWGLKTSNTLTDCPDLLYFITQPLNKRAKHFKLSKKSHLLLELKLIPGLQHHSLPSSNCNAKSFYTS